MISFWEKESLLKYDIIVVGAGIVGLQTAIGLKKKFPKRDILVLERGLLPSGASSKNAGFAATGSLSELIEDNKIMSEEEIATLFMNRKKGLDLLRNQLGDAAIGYVSEGSHELLTEEEGYKLESLEHFNQLLKPYVHQEVFSSHPERIEQFGFSTGYFKHCIANSTEASLHTGKMMKSLASMAISKGIEIKTGADVIGFEEQNNKISVQVKNGNEHLSFETEQIVICTNAFSSRFFPEEDIIPGRGQMLVTKPIQNLKIKGTFYNDEGYYYFRNFGNRVILGGGRNMNFEEERTLEIKENPIILSHLEDFLKTHLLPNTPFEIDMRWSGIMAFGKSKSPIIISKGERIHGGFRLGGMGVALGSMVALQLCEKIN